MSTLGNVRRGRPGRGAVAGKLKAKIVKVDNRGRPYATVSFPDPAGGKRVNGKRKMKFYKVSVLMLLSFVGPRPGPGHIASHLDDNPLNDVVTNLAWETWATNNRRRALNEMIDGRAERVRRAKFWNEARKLDKGWKPYRKD